MTFARNHLPIVKGDANWWTQIQNPPHPDALNPHILNQRGILIQTCLNWAGHAHFFKLTPLEANATASQGAIDSTRTETEIDRPQADLAAHPLPAPQTLRCQNRLCRAGATLAATY